MPLICLGPILRSRTVPYFPNAGTLRRLARNYPGFRFTGDFMLEQWRKNFVLHESAHCIADRLFKDAPSPFAGITDRRRALIIRGLAAEAYANATELHTMSEAYSQRDPYHILVLQMNSYGAPSDLHNSLVRTLDEEFGRTVFVFMWFAYLCANLCRDDLARSDRKLILQATVGHVSASHRLAFGQLYDYAFILSRRFREQTIENYFAMLGAERDLRAVRTSNMIFRRPIFARLLDISRQLSIL